MDEPDGLLTLDQAIGSLYAIAVEGGRTTSTLRLSVLARFCVQELARRGLRGAQTEVTIPGGGRDKDWDVAWKWAGKYRLVISLKSILKNLGGTVPNRIDDLMGETSNIQLYSPEVVCGYVMVFNTAEDLQTPEGPKWLLALRGRLARLSGRRAPYWSPGTFESHAVVAVNFSNGPVMIEGYDEVGRMFDELVQEVRARNPGIEEIGS